MDQAAVEEMFVACIIHEGAEPPEEHTVEIRGLLLLSRFDRRRLIEHSETIGSWIKDLLLPTPPMTFLLMSLMRRGDGSVWATKRPPLEKLLMLGLGVGVIERTHPSSDIFKLTT